MVQKFSILFIFVFSTSIWVSVNADCSLYLDHNSASPHVIKKFDSKHVLLKKISDQNSITLDEGETIIAFCSAEIRVVRSTSRNYYHNENNNKIIANSMGSIELSCVNNRWRYKTLESLNFQNLEPYSDSYEIACDGKVLLYESRTILPNCEKYENYAIGKQISADTNDLISAGICYDLPKMILKYATYLAYRSKYEFVTNKNLPLLQPPVTLDVKLKNLNEYFYFMSEDAFNTSYRELKNTKPYLDFFDFDFKSLILDAALKDELESYADIFNIVWWRNLRLGNWRNFLNAFEERTKFVKYMVYAGSSGELEIPTPASSCNKTDKLHIEAFGLKVKPPKYIWYYLRSLHENITENFVVIAYNSPFYDQRNVSAIIFCKDVCDEVDWLRTSLFDKFRLLPTMGVVFCCNADDIAEQLSNFPHNATNVSAIQAPVITETYASTTTTPERHHHRIMDEE